MFLLIGILVTARPVEPRPAAATKINNDSGGPTAEELVFGANDLDHGRVVRTPLGAIAATQTGDCESLSSSGGGSTGY